MKKFYYLLASLPLLGAAACSNEEISEPENPKVAARDEIRFAPTFDRSGTRAGSIYDSNNIPDQFVVGAFHFDSKGDRYSFFTGDTYQNKNGQWVNTSGTRYWPDGGYNDFYAFVFEGNPKASDMTVDWNDYIHDGTLLQKSIANPNKGPYSITPFINTYVVDSLPSEQFDLLYAVKKNVTRETGTIPLNFRHAKSQVVFDAMNVSPNIYVEVSSVGVGHIYLTYGFNLPDAETAPGTQNDSKTFVQWTQKPNDSRKTVTATLPSPVALVGNVDETVAPTPLTSNSKDLTMMLVPDPNQVGPYTPNVSNPNGSPAIDGKNGTYFAINCTIWGVQDPSKGHDPATDVILWGNDDGTPKVMYVPADFRGWQQGKRYVYTFEFGKGNAGYDPATDKPVLAPVAFNVTVDDWIDVNKTVNLPNN